MARGLPHRLTAPFNSAVVVTTEKLIVARRRRFACCSFNSAVVVTTEKLAKPRVSLAASSDLQFGRGRDHGETRSSPGASSPWG